LDGLGNEYSENKISMAEVEDTEQVIKEVEKQAAEGTILKDRNLK
jgi:hypothetical protein